MNERDAVNSRWGEEKGLCFPMVHQQPHMSHSTRVLAVATCITSSCAYLIAWLGKWSVFFDLELRTENNS